MSEEKTSQGSSPNSNVAACTGICAIPALSKMVLGGPHWGTTVLRESFLTVIIMIMVPQTSKIAKNFSEGTHSVVYLLYANVFCLTEIVVCPKKTKEQSIVANPNFVKEKSAASHYHEFFRPLLVAQCCFSNF